jgi:hypothetical protein
VAILSRYARSMEALDVGPPRAPTGVEPAQ